MTRPLALLPSLALAVLCLAWAGCSSDASKTGINGAKGSSGVPDPLVNGSIGSSGPTSERELRYIRVDSMISQWDGLQSNGQDAEATGLAAKIRQDVDGDYAAFAAFARGDAGLRRQYLGVQALGFASDRSATSVLVDRLASGDSQLVGNALIALKLRSDPATPLPAILTLLRSSASEPRRFAPLALANVLQAREKAKMPLEPRVVREAMTGLIGLIEDRDPIVRLHAAKAMGALRQPDASDFLVLLLKDEHPRIRIAAAAALERIGDARSFPQVVALLEASDADLKPFVRDVLFTYAERLQGAPLTAVERESLGTSTHAWDRWFAERLKTSRKAG